MRKITKALVAILLIAVMSMTSVTAFAANEGVSPRLSHVENGDFSFFVVDNVGYLEVAYYGYSSFARADLNVKVQKRSLLVFWNDVAEWNASSTEIDGYFYREIALNGSGMYRATFTLTITGNDGTTDVIQETIKSKF